MFCFGSLENLKDKLYVAPADDVEEDRKEELRLWEKEKLQQLLKSEERTRELPIY